MTLAGRTAPSRVLFGPHVTNLATSARALSPAHTAYYAARAVGGAGVVVVEVASVHDADRPYARAPLAAVCGPGWAAVAAACRPALVIAGLGHAGEQTLARGRPPWPADGGTLVRAFTDAARRAVDAGCDGVEIAAGQHALLRQVRSGLTASSPSDDLLRRVLDAVRAAVGDAVLGVRLTVDELAPWAGITLDDGTATAARVAGAVDYLVPVRGSGLSVDATRPDAHTPPAFFRDTCARVRDAVAGRTAVVLAGSVVDPDDADTALAAGVADLVEMTRAQIADPTLVATRRAGHAPRPCVLTNQECRVRDLRNPLVSCTVAPHVDVATPRGDGAATVVGGGPAGLEAARALALAGAAVTLHERDDEVGGLLRDVARLPGHGRFARLVGWWRDELERLGVRVVCGSAPDAPDGPTVWATGGDGPTDPVAVLRGGEVHGPVAVVDPVGDHVGVGIATLLAGRGLAASLVTPDPLAGKLLARRGDLAAANARLLRAGVDRVVNATVVGRSGGVLVVRDVTGALREVPAATVVDCAPGRPGTVPDGAVGAGDVVAPRTVHEAVLEGRRAAAAVLSGLSGVPG